MSDSLFYIVVTIAGVALFVVMIWYFLLSKKLNKDDIKYINELKKGTQNNAFSLDVIYQKLYVFYTRIPFLKRYLAKLRRRLEIINVEDEYLTRKQASEYLSKALLEYVLKLELLPEIHDFDNPSNNTTTCSRRTTD